MGMFLHQDKPKDFDCGYNLDLMIAALPRIKERRDRIDYAKRIIELIKQSHPNWVEDDGKSSAAWDHYFELAEYNPRDYGIRHPHRDI
jgi:hypothetical protein